MISSLYLDDVRLDDGVSVFCQGVNNLTFPEIAYTVTKRGSFSGQSLSLGKFGGYKFSLDFLIKGTTLSDLATQRNNFLKILGSVISNGSAVLKINEANSNALQAVINAISITGNVATATPLTSQVLVEVVTEYPFLVSQTLHTSDVGIYTGGGLTIPSSVPMDMSNGGTNETTLTNAGNYDAYPLLTFQGPLIDPSLYNATTDKTLSAVGLTLTADDKLIVDMYNRTALLYQSSLVGTNARRYLLGDFWTLIAGNNIIRLAQAEYNAYGKCTVDFRDHYLGI